MTEASDQMQARLNKLRALQDAGRDPFAHTTYPRTHSAAELTGDFEKLEGREVAVAGRLMALRAHGKSIFADLRDASGNVQLFVRLNNLGEEGFAQFKELDLGDIIGASGTLMKTRTGEVSVEVTGFTLLAKSLRPLPEKFHGLKDPELRYRQRYLDFMVNDEAREKMLGRARLIARLRRGLNERGFIEFQTPILQPIYGGAHARPFTTHHNALDMQLYMRIAPELYLKRLLVGGFERVYEIGPMFRNEGVDTRHNPEFTMVEMYQAYADWEDMMALAEGLVAELVEELCGGTTFTYCGHEIDVTPPWRRLPLVEAVAEATGVDFTTLDGDEAAHAACAKLDLGDTDKDSWGGLLDKCFDRYVQPELIQPTFVTEHPVAVSPLAKEHADKPGSTYRFEIFIGGEEAGNAFSELNDPLDQRRRFEQQVAARKAGDAEAHPLDEDFLTALEYAMPPAGGMGMGVDRLAMLLLDTPNLREVIAFPLLRTRESE
ncbi:MAG: lysine--tRNA ligase [Armatimonadetes bacterium]|nr:lysine--tRNA ligase [Armatimonadota bacterium]